MASWLRYYYLECLMIKLNPIDRWKEKEEFYINWYILCTSMLENEKVFAVIMIVQYKNIIGQVSCLTSVKQNNIIALSG